MNYPIYRKYSNNKSYFKIYSASQFEELLIIGKNYKLTSYEAKILPDRVMIEDMLNLEGNHWLECSKNEFEEKLDYCIKHFNMIA